MTARILFGRIATAFLVLCAFVLLVTSLLLLAMPTDWEYRFGAEATRKLCFVVFTGGMAVKGVLQMRAKKLAAARSQIGGTVAPAHPAFRPRRRRKQLVK